MIVYRLVMFRGVFRGGHRAMAPPPFGLPGLQNCIEKWAKLRHGFPLWKLGIRFDCTKGMLRAFLSGFGLKVGLKASEELFFLLFTWFWAKNGTKFEWRPFFFALHLILGKKWDEIWVKTFFILFTWFRAKMGWNLSETISNSVFVFLKFSEVSGPPLRFQNPVYATGHITKNFCKLIEIKTSTYCKWVMSKIQ